MAKTVNERSPLYMTLTFKDEVGDPLIPSTVEWRLEKRVNGAQLVDWTALTPPAATMNVVIPATYNTILNEENVREEHTFGVRVDYGLATEAHQEFQYHVLNLHVTTGVPGP